MNAKHPALKVVPKLRTVLFDCIQRIFVGTLGLIFANIYSKFILLKEMIH